MSKATIVKITSLNENGAQVITDTGQSFLVNSFAPMNGVLKITAPMGSITIYELAEIVSGCFDGTSIFGNVNWVTFTFNTITVTVTRGAAKDNPEYIVSKWENAWNEELQVNKEIEKVSAYINEDIDD